MSEQLILGDCLWVMRQMVPESVSAVISSPPYNLGTRYSSYDDTLPRDEYLCWMRSVFAEIRRVLKPDGHFFLVVSGKPSDPWVGMDVANVARSLFVLQNSITWVKSISIGEESFGHYKPINSPRFLNHNHEQVFHFTLTGKVPIDRLAIGVPYMDQGNLTRGTRGKNGDLRCQGNVWWIPYETIQKKSEKGNHPAIFPVELARRCLKLCALPEGSVVLDPFCGVGTVLVACQELGLRGIGVDIDAEYIEHARRRLEETKC